MIGNRRAPEALAHVDHAGILLALIACRADVLVNDLPEDPCGSVEVVAVGGDALREPETGCHCTGILSGLAVAVNLAHPEVLAGGKRGVFQFGALPAAVCMRVDASDRLFRIGGELVECVDLCVDRGLVRAGDDDIAHAAGGHRLLQLHDDLGFGITEIEVTALLLRTVCAPEIGIGLVHCLNGLDINAPFIAVMLADLCEIFRECGVGIVLEVIRARIGIAGRAAGFAHIIRRRIREHFHDRIIAGSFDAPHQDIALIRVGRPVVDGLTVDELGIAGHIGVCAGDVVVLRIVAAADVEAHDVQAQAVISEEDVSGLLRERVGIADAVCPPAERGAPALKDTVIDGVGVVGRDNDRGGCGSGERDRSAEGTGEAECHHAGSPFFLFRFHFKNPLIYAEAL